MTRRLLVGRAGAGKTHACLALLARALAERRRALLLVPTYGQAEHVRYLLLDRVGGLAARAVETFSSLAEGATGVRLAALAHPAERDLWAERALAPDFPETARLPGFRAEFLAAVKEVKENGVPPDEAVAHARAHFPEGSRGRRLFEAFHRYRSLARRMDHEDLLAAARDAVPALRDPPDLLLVDGFHDFTGLELQILEAIAARARETVVTLPLDPDDMGTPVFASAARTAARFRDFRLDPLRGNRRAAPAPLRHLERALFAPSSGRVPAGDAVRLLACASDDDEADRLARLVARSGRRYGDFLVVRRTFEGAHDLFRAAFRRHGIPLRLFGSQPLPTSGLARFLRALAGRLEPAEVPALLRSPLLLDAPPAEEVDALAAHLRERGAPETWAAFPNAASLLGRLEGARGPLHAAIDAHLGVRDALVRAPDGDEALAGAARALAAVRAEAEALSDLPLLDAAARLLARLPHLRAPARDRRHDCVYAVEALDARQWEKPVVLASGLGVQSFPRQVRQDLFLRDEERARFQAERGVALPLRRLREEEERYLFYVTMTRAREALALSYAAYDEEGTAQPPSPYLEEAVARFDGLETRKVALAEQYVRGADVVAREELFAVVADGVARLASGRARGDEAALAVALHDLGAVPREELARPRRHELARLLPAPLSGVDPAARLSASGINDYLRCPYLFLARRVLRVGPARPLELDPALRGAIVHETLERFVLSGRAEDPGALFDALFAERTRPFRRTLRNEAHRRWMRAAVVRAADAMRDLPIERVEVPFEVAVGDVVLNGRVDRVDAHALGAIVRDYKTGHVDPRAAREGRDVQLDVYLLAVREPAGAVYERLRAGDAVGFVLKGAEGAVSGDVEVLTREALEARMRRTRETIARVAARARAGRLAVDPAEPERCTRDQCDAYDLCRVPRARFLARRAREREAPR